jgi:hypothetical protein
MHYLSTFIIFTIYIAKNEAIFLVTPIIGGK